MEMEIGEHEGFCSNLETFVGTCYGVWQEVRPVKVLCKVCREEEGVSLCEREHALPSERGL